MPKLNRGNHFFNETNKLFYFVLCLISLSGLYAAPPLISDVPDQVIAQSASTGTLYFTIGDTSTLFSALVVTATSSNTALVPQANLNLGGNSSQRSINVTPTFGMQGTATITITVTDGQAVTANSTFNVTVTAPNTPPAIAGLPSYQIVRPGQSPAAVSFIVGDAETAAGLLNVAATSSNTNLVPNANLTLGGSGSNRTVQVMPVAGQTGVAVI